MTDKTPRGVDALERALTLLDCFDGETEALTLAELARRSGLYKSTILRLAVSLGRFGYMTRQSDGRYRLGASLWRLGNQYRRHFDLSEVVRPELRRLVEATSETASYYVRDGDARVCLYRLNSPRAIRHHLVEGVRLPLDGGASAHVLRAFGPDARERDAAVRAAGYAASLGERDPDVAAVAAPVFGRDGTLRGALAVSGLVSRFDPDCVAFAAGEVREAAARLSAALAAA